LGAEIRKAREPNERLCGVELRVYNAYMFLELEYSFFLIFICFNYFSSFNCRIKWLQRGSREVFGTVIEDVIYLLIDTSLSMQHHMPFVKDKVYYLFQV